MHNIGKNYLYWSALSKHVRKLEMGKSSQSICEDDTNELQFQDCQHYLSDCLHRT